MQVYENRQAFTFMRRFCFNSCYSASLARFPFEKLDEVIAVLESTGYKQRSEALFFCDATYDQWLYLARKSGEPMYNIIRLPDLPEESIDDLELGWIIHLLEEAGIKVSVPKRHMEYISPIPYVDEAHRLKGSYTRTFASWTIEEAEEEEKMWLKKRYNMSAAQLAIKEIL